MDINELNMELAEALSKSIYNEKRLVFGKGPKNAAIALIGEAPGKDEEDIGEPFVGKAGKVLTEFLCSVGLYREDIYITNAVKIRPTKASPKTGKLINRTPCIKEVSFFNSFLHRELEIISPQYIVTMGNIPLNAVSESVRSIGDCHGKIISAGGYKNVFPLYHPAAVIYNKSLKSTYEKDMDTLYQLIKESTLGDGFK